MKKVKKIFSSYTSIIVALMILSGFLLIFCYKLMRDNKTYMFSGTNDYVEIYNGVITLNYDINAFVGSDITYIYEKDIKVVDYEIGYYVIVNGEYSPLSVISDSNEEGFSLKALLEGISTFNITDLPNNKSHFTKNKIKNIEELYFGIKAKDNKGNEIDEMMALDVYKISKY